MTTWHVQREQERDTASATRCAGDLREARERARRADLALRRALRGVEEAESAFHLAARRLDHGSSPR